MAEVKLVVIYPHSKDVAVFEKVYQQEHVPLAVAKLSGKTKIVGTKVVGSPQGIPPFYRIAEVHLTIRESDSRGVFLACGDHPPAILKEYVQLTRFSARTLSAL